MRIQHNIPAMNSYRNLNNNQNAISGNLEKLSSGYKINRAGDDAAGLAISEKMRAQITGLTAASKNVKDGISLVKTAEGALQEVHDMLNRMEELAVQSANGTYDNEVDRANLQKEVDALVDEIDRIAESSNFNGMNLLDGSMSVQGGAAATAEIVTGSGMSLTDEDGGTYYTTKIEGATLEAVLDGTIAGYGYTEDDGGVKTQTVASNVTALTNGDFTMGQLATLKDELTKMFATTDGDAYVNVNYTTTGSGSTAKVTISSIVITNATEGEVIGNLTSAGTVASGATVYSTSVSSVKVPSGQKIEIKSDGEDWNNGDSIKVNGVEYIFTDKDPSEVLSSDSIKYIQLQTATNDGEIEEIDWKTKDELAAELSSLIGGCFDLGANAFVVPDTEATTGLTLQIGDTSDSFNQLNVVVGNCSSTKLGDGVNAIADVDISNQAGAAKATDVIKAAINQISSTRGDLGALQNRLEHTSNNLSVMTENIQDAESTIRDTDVADEMMEYTKNNILIQSAQSMLAQANQLPQGVLQLLG